MTFLPKSSQPQAGESACFHVSRRQFISTASKIGAGATMLGAAFPAAPVFAAGDDLIRIALIGCGGRGSGAASQALETGNVKLVAMADAFDGRLRQSLDSLTKKHPGKVNVPKEHQFVGLDAFAKAIALCDVALLTSPPGFRPCHFEEAVKQGKHVFMEKPVATDAPGIRRVLAASEQAKAKKLKIGVGFQRHHRAGYQEVIKRIHDGAIGDIQALRVYWRGGSRAGLPREDGESELQYQIRNWYYFTWLSGDHIVEQHVHNIDSANWIKQSHPVRAHGVGGRQVRNGKEHGCIFDHHYVEFEYADGCRMHSECTQIPQLWGTVSEHVLGSKGSAELVENRRIFSITGANAFRFKGANADGYQAEHDALFAAIRNDTPFNEAESAAYSTMTAIMGRMATYSGGLIEWDEALNSKLELMPSISSWDAAPPIMPKADGFYPVAMPGQTVAL